MEKRGQIWVETIIYTLIAFVMISLVLFFAGPKITEAQDKTIIEQSIKVMEDINTIIVGIGVPGNKRLVELEIKKGDLKIDGVNNKIIFEMESKYLFSQPGEDIDYGGVIVRTEQGGEFNTITITSDYSASHNLQYQKSNQLKTIPKSASKYKLFITNEGGSPTVINFELG